MHRRGIWTCFPTNLYTHGAVEAALVHTVLDLGQGILLDAKHASLALALAAVSAGGVAEGIFAAEQDFLTNCPAEVERLAVMTLFAFLVDAQPAEEYDVKVLRIEPVGVERLAALKVHNRTVVKDKLNAFDR